MVEYRCSSCGIRLIGTSGTKFKCPECNEGIIGRCPQCRDQSVAYECPECGLQGP